NLDANLNTATSVFEKVPFHLEKWSAVARDTFRHGLPQPNTNNPTEAIFTGQPCGSEHTLQVAVGRLLGYCWPRQLGSIFHDCPASTDDGLEQFATDDGILCLSALQGKASAVGRLSALLAAAFGRQWPNNQQSLLKQEGARCTTLEDWLRDEFF